MTSAWKKADMADVDGDRIGSRRADMGDIGLGKADMADVDGDRVGSRRADMGDIGLGKADMGEHQLEQHHLRECRPERRRPGEGRSGRHQLGRCRLRIRRPGKGRLGKRQLVLRSVSQLSLLRLS